MYDFILDLIWEEYYTKTNLKIIFDVENPWSTLENFVLDVIAPRV